MTLTSQLTEPVICVSYFKSKIETQYFLFLDATFYVKTGGVLQNTEKTKPYLTEDLDFVTLSKLIPYRIICKE